MRHREIDRCRNSGNAISVIGRAYRTRYLYRPPPPHRRFIDRSALFFRARPFNLTPASNDRSIDRQRSVQTHVECVSRFFFFHPDEVEISRSTFPLDLPALERGRNRSRSIETPCSTEFEIRERGEARNTRNTRLSLSLSLRPRFIFIGFPIYFCLPSSIPTIFFNGDGLITRVASPRFAKSRGGGED